MGPRRSEPCFYFKIYISLLTGICGKLTLIEAPVAFSLTMGCIMSQRLLLNIRESYDNHLSSLGTTLPDFVAYVEESTVA